MGPSGCGKTTLLKLIAGLLRPSAGSVVLNTVPDNGRPASALVFQEHGLFPWMTVLENVAFGLETRGVGRSERHERAMTFIASVGLASFAHAFPHQLSVGMRQRVGIGSAFVTDPRLLLLDEPLGSLDAQTRFLLQEELLRLWTRSRSAVVYVTHDIEEAVVLGDRVLVLTGRPGRIQGEITVPLGRPRTLEYAATRRSPRSSGRSGRCWRRRLAGASRCRKPSPPAEGDDVTRASVRRVPGWGAWPAILFVAAIIVAWELWARGKSTSVILFPAPSVIAATLLKQARSGELLRTVGATLRRLASGRRPRRRAGALPGPHHGVLAPRPAPPSIRSSPRPTRSRRSPSCRS